MFLIIGYIIFLSLFSLYSYALMDPNITFLNAQIWTEFRNWIIYFGYYQREWSSVVYILGIIGLFAFHYAIIRKFPLKHVFHLALLIGAALVVSYPFLSHDLFNYMFDAKIATFYHQNPYLKRALDFPNDPWTRFMHWTQRTYPYGPTFILITLIPSFLSFGKFLLAFIFFKAMNVILYIWAVWILERKNKVLALAFATSPLVLVEGLMNAHNDLVAVAFAIAGMFYVFESKQMRDQIIGRTLLIVSGGIKYITTPFIFISKIKYLNWAVFVLLGALLYYLSFRTEIQPWYFLALLAVLPFVKKDLHKLDIFFFGLLVSYYPYVRFGGWDKQWKVDIKHEIIWIFAAINVAYLFFVFAKRKFFTK